MFTSKSWFLVAAYLCCAIALSAQVPVSVEPSFNLRETGIAVGFATVVITLWIRQDQWLRQFLIDYKAEMKSLLESNTRMLGQVSAFIRPMPMQPRDDGDGSPVPPPFVPRPHNRRELERLERERLDRERNDRERNHNL